MASIVLASVGSSVGNYFLPGLGGRILGAYGGRLGRWVDGEIGLGPEAAHKDGPRLENLRVQDSRYGVGIPLVFGCARVAGNIIWASNLIEASHETSTGGGKGGGSSSTRTTYSYSVHCAVAICAGEIGGIATIWADGKVIYQNGIWKSGVVDGASIYTGTAAQGVDPLLESMIGNGNVPAYRGIAYIVLDNLQLGNFGNRLPNLTFEVLPAHTVSQPLWLGGVNPGINHRVGAALNEGMPPIVTEGSAARARKMLVGGYTQNGSATAFNVVEYDVTGDEPLEVNRAQSASFTVNSVSDHAWAKAPDGRFVAMFMKPVDSGAPHRFAIYDLQTKQFGDVFSVNIGTGDNARQLAWIDAQSFLISGTSGDMRGVYVFARAGTSVISLGFFDVWGAGTATTRVPLMYTQFVPMAGGLLNIMADYTPFFTALYVRPITWEGNGVDVGAGYTLANGLSVGSGSGPQVNLLRTADDEWTLFYSTVIDMRMMSFRPGVASAIITRPWQTLTNASLPYSYTSHPVVMGNRIVVIQRSNNDNYYGLSEIALNQESFEIVVDGAAAGNFAQPCLYYGAAAIDGSRFLIQGISGFYDSLSQVGIIRRCQKGDTLDHIVAGLLERAGYDSADYDVGALSDVPVDGYAVPEAMSASAAIAPLQVYEPFDLIESGAELKAVKHGHVADTIVPKSEMHATEKLSCDNPLREQTRAQELDLPLEIKVDYIDASRDYEVGSQRARRTATRGARVKAKVEMPVVCTAAKAKRIAEARLFALWSEREHVRLKLSRTWLRVDPGDVLDLGDGLMRVESVRSANGLLDVRGVLVPAAPVSSEAQAENGETGGFHQVTTATSSLYLMDLPMLRASDDQPGVYAAVSGVAGWPGATVWRASDGVSYSNVASFSSPATAGMATTVLGHSQSCYMDRANAVNVQLLQGSLASCSENDLLNGANVALLGDEIIQFKTATLLGPGLYALSNLLRGRCGTEEYISGHTVGERFVLLRETVVQFLPAQLTDRGGMYVFRALSQGQTLGEARPQGFTYNLNTLKPLAPVHVCGTRSAGAGSDLALRWKRRARKNGAWIDHVDVPLDEDAELYDVEIMNGSTVVRTFSNLSSSSVVYSAAEQSADWGGGVPPQFNVNVYQLSARYGRGQKASAVI